MTTPLAMLFRSERQTRLLWQNVKVLFPIETLASRANDWNDKRTLIKNKISRSRLPGLGQLCCRFSWRLWRRTGDFKPLQAKCFFCPQRKMWVFGKVVSIFCPCCEQATEERLCVPKGLKDEGACLPRTLCLLFRSSVAASLVLVRKLNASDVHYLGRGENRRQEEFLLTFQNWCFRPVTRTKLMQVRMGVLWSWLWWSWNALNVVCATFQSSDKCSGVLGCKPFVIELFTFLKINYVQHWFILSSNRMPSISANPSWKKAGPSVSRAHSPFIALIKRFGFDRQAYSSEAKSFPSIIKRCYL